MDGETFKKREFSKTSVSVSANQPPITNYRRVGVLCTFYTYDGAGVLTAPSERKHSFADITNYGGTINKPTYSEEKLTISPALLVELEKLLMNYNINN